MVRELCLGRVRDPRRAPRRRPFETTCPDCGEPIEVDVLASGPEPDDLFHCLVPAERWWDDIVFT